MQTDTLKMEGQRRKVRKGIAAVVVGGVWLSGCMTASVNQGENLGGGSSGWLQGEVTERTPRAFKLDQRTFWSDRRCYVFMTPYSESQPKGSARR